MLGLQLIKDVGERAGKLIVEERERHGLYKGAGDLVRRTGLKHQAVESLVMAGAFDVMTPNRRAALWDAVSPFVLPEMAREPSLWQGGIAPLTWPTSPSTSGW